MGKDPDKNIKNCQNFSTHFLVSIEGIFKLIVYAGNNLFWGPTSHGKSLKFISRQLKSIIQIQFKINIHML